MLGKKKSDVALEHISVETSTSSAVSPTPFFKKKDKKNKAEGTFTHRTTGFSVKIVQADGLAAADLNGRSDPYVKLRLGANPKQKTRVVDRSLNPVWNESFYFATWGQNEQLILTVWDYDRQIAGMFGTKDFLGSLTIDKPNTADGVLKGTYPLVADAKHKSKTDVTGTIEVEIVDYAKNKAFVEGEREGIVGQASARNLSNHNDEKFPPADISVLPLTRNQSSVQDDSPYYTWDMCMVFNIGSKTKIIRKNPRQDEQEFFAQQAADCIRKMKQAGLKTHLYKSSDGDEIYCLIAASEQRLRIEADRTDYELELDYKACINHGKERKIKLATITGSQDPKLKSFTEDAWKHIYGSYIAADEAHPKRELLYRHYDDEGPLHPNTIFRTVDRLKLTVSILEAEEIVGGAGIRIENCCNNGNHPLQTFYGLHQESKVQEMEAEWTKWHSLTHQPLKEIRNYYGEQVAMYFSFMEYYSRWLIIPSIVGFIAFIWQVSLRPVKIDIELMPYYVIFVAVWATSFLEAWKRRQSTLAAQWGTSNLHLREQPRADFSGSWEPSLVHGRLEEQFPLRVKVIRLLLSHSVIATLIVAVIASFTSVYILRTVIRKKLGDDAAILTAFINAAQIQILNVIYGYVARRLNDWENYKTDTEYENALISKTFLFKFINSYNTLFYIAFFKRYDDGGCGDKGCLRTLQEQLAVVFGSQLVVNNLIGFLRPRIDAWRKERHENSTLTQEQIQNKSDAEHQFVKNDYDSTFDDMDEVSIQFGYVSLFVVAFPIAPLLALINNAIMVRLDAIKLLRSVKRPEPRSAKDIGTWQTVYNIIGFIAVITNVALLTFASDAINIYIPSASNLATDGCTVTPRDERCTAFITQSGPYEEMRAKFWVFIIMEHLLFLLKFAIAFFVPDQTETTTIHLQRQEYIVEKLIEGVAEEADVVPLAADPLATAALLTEAEKEERIFSLYDVTKIRSGFLPDEHHSDPHHAMVAKQGLKHISTR